MFRTDKMTICNNCTKILDTDEEKIYNGSCRQCVINEIRKHVADLEKRHKKKKLRTPSNVIYVVIRPQPGQVRGDWGVRGHEKIYSNHRTKMTAINKARKIARKHNATIMVQNTDGTFSRGFRPRAKKRSQLA